MSNFVNIMDIIYPVGSIYQSMSTTSPADFIGGTWTKIKTFLYGADTANQTGGEATHTLTVDEIPSHSHSYFEMSATGNWSVSPGNGGRYQGTWKNASYTGASTQQFATLHNLLYLVQDSLNSLKTSSLNLSEVAYV